jgi:hypothetical protein
MELSPTTELEAVNQLLKAVGETPINTLDDLGFTDAAIARDTLRTKAREIQSLGWYFNRDYSYYFTPAADGMVVLPKNALSIRPSTDDTRRIVQRPDMGVTPPVVKLWNADDSTFLFDTDNGPTVEVIWQFPFETLPEAARRYITVKAATQFQAQFQGSEQSYGFTTDDEKFALKVLTDEERLYEPRANVFNDSAAVSEIWTR